MKANKNETIREYIKRKFSSEPFIMQVKDGVTFQQAKDAMDEGKLKETICAGNVMDTAVRFEVWQGFKERFGTSYIDFNRAYFANVERKEASLPNVFKNGGVPNA